MASEAEVEVDFGFDELDDMVRGEEERHSLSLQQGGGMNVFFDPVPVSPIVEYTEEFSFHEVGTYAWLNVGMCGEWIKTIVITLALP
jgi:hypothetical protein